MPMPPTFQRTFSRNVGDYVAVAGEVERFCAENRLPDAVSFKVSLVLEELVLNLIDHAVGSATDRLDVRIEREPGQVVLVLEDDGVPFDPRSAPAFDKAKPLEERRPRGMGIQLVRSVTKDISYERVGSRNRLRVAIAD
jgi:anti-sigma regulatory factor (Ser/Thr protein kinase)